MDNLISKKALLDRVRLLEGSKFECDEKAILNEYQIHGENKSSIAIKVLSIFGGFLATLTFLGFLAIAGLYDSEFGLSIFGIVFIISALWLNKEYDKLIIDTFSISTYIIGFALLTFGLVQLDFDEDMVTILISIIAFSSLFIAQNYILAFISVLIISGSFITLIISNDLYNLVHLYIAVVTLILTYLFLNESKIFLSNIKLSKLYDPVRIGLVFSLLFGLVTVGKRDLIPISQNYVWLSSIVMIFVSIYLVYVISEINEIVTLKGKILIYSLCSLVLLLTIFSPAISGSIIIILLSFLVNYKTGLVIGIISFIYFITQYYYDLNFNLLTKSIILFSTGIVFLLLYLFTIKKLYTNEKI